MKERRWVSFLRWIIGPLLGMLFAGCAMDLPSPARRLGVSGQKVSLRVGVILSPSIRQVQYVGKAKQSKMSDCPGASCLRNLEDTTVTIKVGESSAEFFQKQKRETFPGIS